MLVGNLVTHLPHYRLYTIAVMPDSLRVLDFAKVTDTERKQARQMFAKDENREKIR